MESDNQDISDVGTEGSEIVTLNILNHIEKVSSDSLVVSESVHVNCFNEKYMVFEDLCKVFDFGDVIFNSFTIFEVLISLTDNITQHNDSTNDPWEVALLQIANSLYDFNL